MKILLLHPGRMPQSRENINCFSDVWAYYLATELKRHVKLKLDMIPLTLKDQELVNWFAEMNVDGYDAVIAVGLRYFSTVPREIGEVLRKKLYPGFLCQLYDGSRLDNDPVDITFTFRDDSFRYPRDGEANRYVRHHSYNAWVGWAADPELNSPAQDPTDLRILVDHTNYGKDSHDVTLDILAQIKEFVNSGDWSKKYQSVSVRRFVSGGVEDVDLTKIDSVERYDRSKTIPLTEVCKEHSAAHVFCVTHPESVGQVVLETATAGALIVTPADFIAADRLATVRSVIWKDKIDWAAVLRKINVARSRELALKNSWEQVAKNIRQELWLRKNIRSGQ